MTDISANTIRVLFEKAPYAIILGTIILYNIFRTAKQTSEYDILPISKLRSAPKGTVRIKGKLIPRTAQFDSENNREEVLARCPSIQGKTAIAWFHVVKGRYMVGARGWKSIVSYYNYLPSSIDDGTREALIHFDGPVKFDIKNTDKFTKTAINKLPPKWKNLKEFADKEGNAVNTYPTVRIYEESAFTVDQEIEVIGELKRTTINNEEALVISNPKDKEIILRHVEPKQRNSYQSKTGLVLQLLFAIILLTVGLTLILSTLISIPGNYVLLIIILGSLMLTSAIYYKFLKD